METSQSEVSALLSAINAVAPFSNGSAAAALRRALRELVADDQAASARIPAEVLKRDRNRATPAQPSTRPATQPQRRIDDDWPQHRDLIRAEMKQQGISPDALADLLGLPPGSMSRWLTRGPNGHPPLPPARAKLLGWLGQPSQPEPPADPERDNKWTVLREQVNARIRERGLDRHQVARQLGWSKHTVDHRLRPGAPPPAAAYVDQLRAWLNSTNTSTASAQAVALLPHFTAATVPRPPRQEPDDDDRLCCWPIGEPGEPGFRYCGAAVIRRGKPYCPEHAKGAFLGTVASTERSPERRLWPR